MPSPKLYRFVQNCSKCLRSRIEGATLMRCKACGDKLYCSKECQKADWPVHRIECIDHQAARRTSTAQPQDIQEANAFNRWMCLHRPALEFISSQELDMFRDPSKGAHTVFKICVQLRPQETNPRKKFEVTQAAPCAMVDFAMPFSLYLRCKYEEAQEVHIPLNLSTFLIAIMHKSSPLPIIVTLGLEPSFYKSCPPYISPAEIIDDINNGEVC